MLDYGYSTIRSVSKTMVENLFGKTLATSIYGTYVKESLYSKALKEEIKNKHLPLSFLLLHLDKAGVFGRYYFCSGIHMVFYIWFLKS